MYTYVKQLSHVQQQPFLYVVHTGQNYCPMSTVSLCATYRSILLSNTNRFLMCYIQVKTSVQYQSFPEVTAMCYTQANTTVQYQPFCYVSHTGQNYCPLSTVSLCATYRSNCCPIPTVLLCVTYRSKLVSNINHFLMSQSCATYRSKLLSNINRFSRCYIQVKTTVQYQPFL